MIRHTSNFCLNFVPIVFFFFTLFRRQEKVKKKIKISQENKSRKTMAVIKPSSLTTENVKNQKKKYFTNVHTTLSTHTVYYRRSRNNMVVNFSNQNN